MAFLKSSSAGAKKQTPMPGPNSAAYKKIVAAQRAAKAAAIAKQALRMAGSKKRPRSCGAFPSLKSRQKLVERIKRAIWASFKEINEAIILLAKGGNCNAAKTLFEFAGVYSLPTGDDDNTNASAAPAPVAPDSANKSDECDPVSGLFRSIGLDPCGEPEPAAQGL